MIGDDETMWQVCVLLWLSLRRVAACVACKMLQVGVGGGCKRRCNRITSPQLVGGVKRVALLYEDEVVNVAM